VPAPGGVRRGRTAAAPGAPGAPRGLLRVVPQMAPRSGWEVPYYNAGPRFGSYKGRIF